MSDETLQTDPLLSQVFSSVRRIGQHHVKLGIPQLCRPKLLSKLITLGVQLL
jgi:hypothetical protein